MLCQQGETAPRVNCTRKARIACCAEANVLESHGKESVGKRRLAVVLVEAGFANERQVCGVVPG